MRILQVRFQNLNSLVGEWQIDLTHPDFVSDGIFAITGPTGAGKTTILDAICLALYARTPRLSRVNANNNEIMSRQTGACFAEVTFETRSGRYRCHWGQRRAFKKPDGNLREAQHELSRADTGEILAAKVTDVAKEIEQITGMDFQRFTRSMLLAQGDFAAFLQASPDERAPILEQLTGTEIYSDISIRVHERQRDEREKRDRLLAETAGIAVLTQEQEQALGHDIEAKQGEAAALAAQLAQTTAAINWRQGIDALAREIAGLAEEAEGLQAEVAAFQPERDRLDRAERVAALDGAYAALHTTRKQQAEDRASLASSSAALPELEAAAENQGAALQRASQQTAAAKDALTAAAPTWQQVRVLDQKRADQRGELAKRDEDLRRCAAEIEAERAARRDEDEKRAQAGETLAAANDYIAKHARDEWLVGGLAGVEEQFGGLVSAQRDIDQKETAQVAAQAALERAAQTLEARQRETGAKQQALADAAQQLGQERDALHHLLAGRLLREYRTEKETRLREMAYVAKIAELADHRSKLEDGKPCPLCGATAHPYAEGNVPVMGETEAQIAALTALIEQAEAHEADIAKREAAQGAAQGDLNEAEKREIAAANAREAAERQRAETGDELARLRAAFAERRQAVADKLHSLGIGALPEADLTPLIESLRARREMWRVQVDKKVAVERQIADIDSEIKRRDAVIETRSAALAEQRERRSDLQQAFDAGTRERHALYGDKNPDDEERHLRQVVLDAEGAERQAQERHSACQQQWNTAKAQVASLQERIDRQAPELAQRETGFEAALASRGLADEAQYLAALLPAEQRAALQAAAKELDTRQTDLTARQTDREARLKAEESRQITDAPLEALVPQRAACEAAQTKLRDDIAGLQHQLRDNAAAKERIAAQRVAIEAQEAEYHRWKNLSDLIGSSDGKKFRNFAQGLTFELMVTHANRQLHQMTDRYLLVRDDDKPLTLNVIDNYQAGEIRSTKNLSGGESFIVSLSLALGLSHMASQNVQVDSLFLDEGFGTLDEEALDTALETLAGLQRDGKIIGVISHVPALRERIGTQVQVAPHTGGRSRISGPGCARLDAPGD
ncbi:MAG: AAA family ATPase [Myxococcales bacterium]|jgi:exonuclease SbcC|nr:AAA family ATPase [Myxococcales bacterium]